MLNCVFSQVLNFIGTTAHLLTKSTLLIIKIYLKLRLFRW